MFPFPVSRWTRNYSTLFPVVRRHLLWKASIPSSIISLDLQPSHPHVSPEMMHMYALNNCSLVILLSEFDFNIFVSLSNAFDATAIHVLTSGLTSPSAIIKPFPIRFHSTTLRPPCQRNPQLLHNAPY